MWRREAEEVLSKFHDFLLIAARVQRRSGQCGHLLYLQMTCGDALLTPVWFSFLVALARVRDLLLSAKHLFVAARTEWDARKLSGN